MHYYHIDNIVENRDDLIKGINEQTDLTDKQKELAKLLMMESIQQGVK